MADRAGRFREWRASLIACVTVSALAALVGGAASTHWPGGVVAGVGISTWLVLVTVFGAWLGRERPMGRAIAQVLLATAPAIALGSAAGSGAAAVTASAPVLGAGILSYGLARCTARPCGDASGAVLGASLPVALLVALPLLADPWIEWDGSSAAAPDRAATVIRLDPMSSVGSAVDGTGWDRQRGRVLYSGASGDGAGLSVIGQYYPARPTTALRWGGAATALGLLMAGLAAWIGPRQPGRTDSRASAAVDATMAA